MTAGYISGLMGSVLGFFFPGVVIYICSKLILKRFFKIDKTTTTILVQSFFFILLWLVLGTIGFLPLFSLFIINSFIYVYEEVIKVKKSK
jgi:hypothetical protein